MRSASDHSTISAGSAESLDVERSLTMITTPQTTGNPLMRSVSDHSTISAGSAESLEDDSSLSTITTTQIRGNHLLRTVSDHSTISAGSAESLEDDSSLSMITTPQIGGNPLLRSVSDHSTFNISSSDDNTPLLKNSSFQHMAVETVYVAPQSKPNTEIHIGPVTSFIFNNFNNQNSLIGNKLLDEFKAQEHNFPLNRNIVADIAFHEDTKAIANVSGDSKGLQNKWYYLIVALVAISGVACVISAMMFSINYFWPSSEEQLRESPEPIDKTSKNEEYISLQKSWWYLIVALVSLSCINLVSTAMFSINKYRNSKTPVQTKFSDVDSVPNELLLGAPRMMNRMKWLAQDPVGNLDPNRLPVHTVIIMHTATQETYTLANCCELIRNIQMNHIEARQWYDIGFNFLIGGDGSVYVGRGWDWVGAHTKGHNVNTLGIAMIGTFTNKLPNQGQMEALRKLLDLGVKLKKIKPDYSLITQCQLQHTWSPERMLAKHLANWPHFDSSLPIQ